MEQKVVNLDTSYTQNRELSWLKFNERVLDEASDDTVPPLEQLKFISIFTSNLDEFCMIRIGSLTDLSLLNEAPVDNKTGMTPKEQLRMVFKAIAPLCQKRDILYHQVETKLQKEGIFHLSAKSLEKKERKYIHQYFKEYIQPVLSPQIIDVQHPFPHLANKALYIVAALEDSKGKSFLGILPVPPFLPEMIVIPPEGQSRSGVLFYVLLEEVILEYTDQMFDIYTITSKSVISVTRNADISPDDESFDDDEDYRRHMTKLLKRRDRLSPVRLESSRPLEKGLLETLCKRLKLKEHQVFWGDCPLVMKYVGGLQDKLPPSLLKRLTYDKFEPAFPEMLLPGLPVLRQVMKQDILLSYPYEQMEPFLRLLKEASNHESVVSIKITIYRLASKSKIVEHLCNAAENGKEVTVLMELRARFDEKNNIEWAERLEESGCRVIYGFDGFKVHSKICLITLQEKGKITRITQIGTGNYNEKTSKTYTDLSLITANREIGEDAAVFFKNMLISNLEGEYASLLVAPASLKSSLMGLIDREIQKAKSGGKGYLLIKANSLTERDLIDKLSEASCAGVKIKLILRGICCIRPGIPGKTENITVFSIVGRFLEHSRVYCFGRDEDMKLYISSADMMTRNITRRVEIACPVFSPAVKGKILHILDTLCRDNVKARRLNDKGDYLPVTGMDTALIDSQQILLEEAKEKERFPSTAHPGFFQRLKTLFSKRQK